MELPAPSPTNSPSSTATSSSSFSSSPSSSSPTSNLPIPIILVPAPSPDGTTQDTRDTMVHLYFILLFLGAVFIILFYLWLRRRKRNKDMRRQRQGQSALAQDIGGWRRVPGMGRRWTSERIEEGLDERGEAPPPYTGPKKSMDTSFDTHLRYNSEDRDEPQFGQASSRHSTGPTIPLQTYQADARHHPPVYEEAESSRSNLSLGRGPTRP